VVRQRSLGSWKEDKSNAEEGPNNWGSRLDVLRGMALELDVTGNEYEDVGSIEIGLERGCKERKPGDVDGRWSFPVPKRFRVPRNI